jgi:hypothetical protein
MVFNTLRGHISTAQSICSANISPFINSFQITVLKKKRDSIRENYMKYQRQSSTGEDNEFA